MSSCSPPPHPLKHEATGWPGPCIVLNIIIIIIYCPVVCTRGHVSTFHFRLSLRYRPPPPYSLQNNNIWQLTPTHRQQQQTHQAVTSNALVRSWVLRGKLYISYNFPFSHYHAHFQLSYSNEIQWITRRVLVVVVDGMLRIVPDGTFENKSSFLLPPP